jgi:hypothetical protein
MAVTPVYGFHYQALSDQPDGAGLGQQLATDVEAKIVLMDAAAATAASNYTNSAHGVIGGTRYTGTGALASTISVEAPTNMSTPSLALKANRLYRIKVRYKVQAVNSSVTSTMARIRDTNLAGAQIAEDFRDAANTGSGHTFAFEGVYETSGAVSKTFIVTLSSTGQTSSVMGGGTTNPTWIEVIDEGPAGVVTIQSTP